LGGLNILYRDQPVRLPHGKVGILSRPTAEPAEARPIVLVLNSGVIHRVGHNRMYVTLARRLAAQGYTVLRFDLAGIGDSEKRPDTLSTADGALADIREVMDWLEASLPARPVAVIGLCIGAYLGVLYGGRDPRVGGVMMMDPFIPRTPRFYFNYCVKEAVRITLNPSSWSGVRKLFRSAFKQAGIGPSSGTAEESFLVRIEDPKIRAQIEESYRLAIDRKLKMLMVLTGGLERQHNYRRQLFDAFPHLRFGDLLKMEYWADVDHIFSHPADRERLFGKVESWLDALAPAAVKFEERVPGSVSA
jgi:alpha/beta superfamily hydrolase